MSNSQLVSYTKLSPNCTKPRTSKIDTITIHCMAGNLSVETCGQLFADPARQASSNYGIGSDGRIGLYVEESNRSWCTSNKANDHRAVTIEVANTTGDPSWEISSAAYASLIKLCEDICKRNDIKQLIWKGDKSLIGQVDKQNMTAHRWFAAKGCPGNWIYNNMGKIASDVNILLANVTVPEEEKYNTETNNIENDEIIWNFLDDKGLNNYAKAGVMGNLFSESGFMANNLQNSFEKKLGYTDESYTKAVDNGTYTNFVRDSAGYGLCQWTFWSRKQALLDFAKAAGKSIGDIHMQLDYMWKEFQGYTAMMNILKNATSVRQASDAMLLQFEKPADQSTAVQVKRAGFGQVYYDKFVKGTAGSGSPKRVVPYTVKVLCELNYRKGPGTNYDTVGAIKDNGVYTITEEKPGEKGAAVWGKLKSGAGYIAISEKYVEIRS